MKTHIIAFTLVMSQGRNPHQFPLAIQVKVDPYAKQLSPSAWIVQTNMDAEGILNLLRPEMVQGDKVTVIHLASGTVFASEGLSPDEKQHLIVE